MDQVAEVVQGRDGWSVVAATEAVYARPGSGWSGRIRRLDHAPARRRWHAVLVVDGVAERALAWRDPVTVVCWLESWR